MGAGVGQPRPLVVVGVTTQGGAVVKGEEEGATLDVVGATLGMEGTDEDLEPITMLGIEEDTAIDEEDSIKGEDDTNDEDATDDEEATVGTRTVATAFAFLYKSLVASFM
ncbi:hypothetical protein E8E13_000367 [Curvularia kusanoi]|uniref:Uncharacterized protein n=1 Tax=Curvularia kusanoi TaxID=90978 RepID=A0A9P4T302_CURKU|nr:hypothetical protein E8E13_000367 [Curvularia kusanoi]